ncbi:hypothetical protein SLS58_006706 [Diplodia intermedia]|uniref:Uncharacterized protein n=1 Tax=Diplodia intermedia TaxID=856260 RepID=A0ABR3TMG2_9PEZI
MSAKRSYDEALADGEDGDSGDTNQNRRVRTTSPGVSDEAMTGVEDDDSGDKNKDRRVRTASPRISDEAMTGVEDDDSGDKNKDRRVHTAPPTMSDNTTQQLEALADQIVQCSLKRSDLLTRMELRMSESDEAHRVINNLEVEIDNLQQIRDFAMQLRPVVTATGLYTNEESTEMEDDVLNPLAVEMARLFSVLNGFVAYRQRVHNDLTQLRVEINSVMAESEWLLARSEELKQLAE